MEQARAALLETRQQAREWGLVEVELHVQRALTAYEADPRMMRVLARAPNPQEKHA